VKRLIYALKKRGDKAVIHGLRGKPSNQRIAKTVEEDAMQILSADLYKGFGPTLASEYLADKHDIEVSRETLRQWMIRAKLWRAKEQKTKAVHVWRPRWQVKQVTCALPSPKGPLIPRIIMIIRRAVTFWIFASAERSSTWQ
jgi:hypothetical protein